jgi:ATP-dependent Clp protease adaptor protein ClpS
VVHRQAKRPAPAATHACGRLVSALRRTPPCRYGGAPSAEGAGRTRHNPTVAVEAPVRTPQRTTDDRDHDDRPWQVIVLNDNHNTFEGVAFALSHTLPGVSYERGIEIADRIHRSGRAVVWSGVRELAEHYHAQLADFGLTMAPLEQV